MKITIEDEGGIFSSDFKMDGLTLFDIIENIANLLQSSGYAMSAIKRNMTEFASDIED